jgi:hypothetical protein
MTDPVPSSMGIKPKKLSAHIVIDLPNIEADSQAWGSYDPEEMAKNYKEQLELNLLEELEASYEDETMGLNIEIKVVDD